jgi:REP element-mobilizing transposase RayT
MSRPPRLEFAGALYHVIARGNEQRDVFRDSRDREVYLRRLSYYRSRFGFRLYAYCLMSNHVHLALETGEVPLSRIVLALHGSYAQAFNRRHKRVGHLFQGRYKAFLVQKSAYLLALVRYIHENPVKAGIVREPHRFRWSSDRFYRGEPPPPWLDTRGLVDLLGEYAGSAGRRYQAFMQLTTGGEYDDLKAYEQFVKGDESFARESFEMASESRARWKWSVEEIARAVACLTGLNISELRGFSQSPERARARAIIGFIARRLGRIPLTKVAEFLHRDGTTLVKDLRRFAAELEGEGEMQKLLTSVLEQLRGTPDSAIQR